MRSLRYPAISKPKAPPTKSKSAPRLYCGQCHEPIDLETLVPKIEAGDRYVHPCGRVLVQDDGPPPHDDRDAPDACRCGGEGGQHSYYCPITRDLLLERHLGHKSIEELVVEASTLGWDVSQLLDDNPTWKPSDSWRFYVTELAGYQVVGAVAERPVQMLLRQLAVLEGVYPMPAVDLDRGWPNHEREEHNRRTPEPLRPLHSPCRECGRQWFHGHAKDCPDNPAARW